MDDFCAEDACSCHSGELSVRAGVALSAGGVDKLARMYAAPVLEELADALRGCVRSQCPAHGDASDEVSALQALVNEADALDADYWASREQLEACR